MLEPIFLSLRIASIATVFSFFLGVFLAYILNKRKIPGKNFWETLITLPMILPPSVTGYFLLILLGKRGAIGSALIDLFGFKIIFTWYAAVIAASIVSLPLMYQNVKAAFLNVDPSYERAARTLGSSEFRIFWTITFPLDWPGIISGITMVFVPSVSTFIISRMLGGGSNLLIGDLIEQQFLGSVYNPGVGSAMSLILMVMILLIMGVINRFDSDEMEGMLV